MELYSKLCCLKEKKCNKRNKAVIAIKVGLWALASSNSANG